MPQDWNTLTKQQKAALLKSAGLPTGLSQLLWSGLQKSERIKLEKATKSKGKGWHEQQEEVRTEKGIEKKAPIHREVAIKKEASEANNTPMQKPAHKERKDPPKEWKKPDMPHEWYEAYKLKYDPHLSHEAQTYFYEKKIAVGKKFFELPEEKVKKLTIAHEVGHIFEELTRELQLSLAGGQASKILGTMKGDYYDGFMGGYRPSEAYANAVAETYSRPEWVKTNHPEIYTLIIETVPADWKAAIEHFISESEGGVESEYRLDKSQGDGEFIAKLIKLPYQVIKINGSNIEYTSPSHEGHIMFQGREYAEGIQKALEDVTEVIRTMQDVLEKSPHIRAYYKFKLTDLKKDINFNKPYVNLVFGLRPVKEYFGRGSATVSARGIKFWWYSPEDSSKQFEANPYYSIEATPPATIAHEIAHTLGSNNEFIDPLAALVAFMFYTKHHEYMAENSFEYMSHEIGRTTSDILRGKLKRPAVTSEMLRYYYAENPLELAAVVGQYSKEDSDKIWAFLAQEKKKAEKPKESHQPETPKEAQKPVLKELELLVIEAQKKGFYYLNDIKDYVSTKTNIPKEELGDKIYDILKEQEKDKPNLVEQVMENLKKQEVFANQSGTQSKYESFLNTMPDMERGKAKKTLNTQINYEGNVMTRREFVEKKAAGGGKVLSRKMRMYKKEETMKEKLDVMWKTVPFGNSEHPATKEYNRLKAELEAGIYKEVLTIQVQDEGFVEVTKTEADYFNYLTGHGGN